MPFLTLRCKRRPSTCTQCAHLAHLKSKLDALQERYTDLYFVWKAELRPPRQLSHLRSSNIHPHRRIQHPSNSVPVSHLHPGPLSSNPINPTSHTLTEPQQPRNLPTTSINRAKTQRPRPQPPYPSTPRGRALFATHPHRWLNRLAVLALD
ncbi:hypothetical protein K402DRAFT_465516, partial [Aulographum hederae CBS 113979]